MKSILAMKLLLLCGVAYAKGVVPRLRLLLLSWLCFSIAASSDMKGEGGSRDQRGVKFTTLRSNSGETDIRRRLAAI